MRLRRGPAHAELPAKKRTMIDIKMTSAVSLLETNAAMNDSKLMLKSAMKVIEDSNASKAKKRKVIKEIGSVQE